MRRAFYQFVFLFTMIGISAFAQLTLTDDATLAEHGIDVLVFHNNHPEGHQGGVEIILHDERIATNGDVRLAATPGRWDPLPTIEEKTVDRRTKSINVSCAYGDLDISYTIHVQAERHKIRLTVDLDRPLPLQWTGKIGFNLELFPPSYFGKTWHCDDMAGIFPRQAYGPISGSNGNSIEPITSGRHLSIAPESELSHITIESQNGDLILYDGRVTRNDGWFVVRTLIPASATHGAVEWIITPNLKKDWLRQPGILLSQVGYHPDQEKTVILELDPETEKLDGIEVVQLLSNGHTKTVLSGAPRKWGKYLRYTYATFDFSQIVDPGIYYIKYDGNWSSPFKIDNSIYKDDVWQPTLDTFFPVHMCHMEIRDRDRVWHGLCHMDDALQAPTSYEHFNGSRQGENTETRFKPYEHIPGLNIGGWHDAGYYDLFIENQAQAVYILALAYEAFDVAWDQTTIRQDENSVELRTPDERNDLLQQIEHGVLFLLGGYQSIGHSFAGVVNPTRRQYDHLGDAMSVTDNQIYDATTAVLPAPSYRRGAMDDRWAFTNSNIGLEYRLAAALAAAGRVLQEFNSELAQDCRDTAAQIWTRYQNTQPNQSVSGPINVQVEKVLAAVELFKLSKSQTYRSALLMLSPEIRTNIDKTGWAVAQVFADLHDDTFDHEFFKAIRKYNDTLKSLNGGNPFGVPSPINEWNSESDLPSYAVKQFYLHRAFPELFDRENLLRVINYLFGCHPGSNISLVSGVGARSVTTAFGTNRADFSYIPGGVVAGATLIQPDFPELKTSWPFLWQQTEYRITGAAAYLFCVLAADDLLSE